MPGQLVIGDRGYCNAPGIVWAFDHGADVLVPLNRGALPLVDEDGTPIHVLPWVRSIGDDTVEDRTGITEGVVDSVRRTITGRLPEDRAGEARG